MLVVFGALKRSLILLSFLLAGCATYQAKPIDPISTEASFRERSLRDGGLREYLAAHGERVSMSVARPDLDLSTLTLIAFYYNPDLDAARARLDLASAAIVTAAGVPNPSVNLPPTYETPLPVGISPIAIFGPTFDIPIETAGKRSYRIAQASNLSQAAAFDVMMTQWQVRSRVRAAAVAYLTAVRNLELRRTEESVRAELVSVFEKSVTTGEVSRPELIIARSNLLDAQLAFRTAEALVADTHNALAVALGVSVNAIDTAKIVWPEFESPPKGRCTAPQNVQAAGLLNRVDVRGALAEYAAAENAVQLEIARQYPDIHLGPGYQFEQNINKWTLGSSLTLPIFNQNQGPIAEAEARRAQAAARFTGLQARVIGETDRAVGQYRSAIQALADANAAFALAREQETDAKRLLNSGEGDRLSLVGARLQRVVAERGRLDALRRAQDALGALEDAAQQALCGEPTLPPIPLSPSSLQQLDQRAPV